MKKFIYLVLFFGLTNAATGQKVTNKMDVDTSEVNIRIGQLENGFRYIIKPIEEENEKMLLDFIVKAGTYDEDENQYELAHLLEHMAYNGTKNFPSLRNNPDFFSRLKMQPRDMSAHIKGFSTQYKFRYPRDVTRALDTALTIFKDIASGNVTFNETSVEAERKALYQEYLYGDNAKSYPSKKIFNTLTGCKNFIPKPQEVEATIMNSSTEELKRYYREWYRPDLMALSVIGNIEDVDKVENKIRNKFKDLEMPLHFRESQNCWKNYINSPKHFIVVEGIAETKQLKPQTKFEFHFRKTQMWFEMFSDEQNQLLWELLSEMIDKRLKDRQLDYNINYQASFYSNYFLPAVTLQVRTSNVDENAIERVFKTLAGISKYGFSLEEWQSIVDERIKNLKEREHSSAKIWSDLILTSLTTDKQLRKSETKSEISFLKNLDIKQVNELFKKKLVWKPDDIAITVPHGNDKNQYTQAKLKSWIENSRKEPEQFNTVKTPEYLLSAKEINQLPKEKIISHRFGNFNEDIIELRNGLKVILKAYTPSTGRYKNKIMVHGFSTNGANCFKSKEIEAMFAPYIIQNAGLGEYNKFEINKLLASTSLPFGVKNYIGPRENGIEAEVLPDDMGILMQMIYLSFVKPRYDPEAFKDWKGGELQKSLRNDSPNNNFLDLLSKIEGKAELPIGSERYKQSLDVNYQESFNIYKNLRANAKDFTFIITGNFKKNKILPILNKYLGNIPNKEDNKECTVASEIDNLKLKKQAQDTMLVLPENVGNNFLAIKYTTPIQSTEYEEEIRVEYLRQALNLKLKELRYDRKLGVYFSVALGSIDYSNKTKNVQIYLQSNKEDFPEVLEVSQGFFEELKTELVSKDFIKTMKESAYLPKWREGLSNRNKSVMRTLYDFYRFGIPMIEKNKAQRFMEGFDNEDLLNAANEYFANDFKSVYIGKPGGGKNSLN